MIPEQTDVDSKSFSGGRQSVLARAASFLLLTFLFSSFYWWRLSTPCDFIDKHSLIVRLMWCPAVAAFVCALLFKTGLRKFGWAPGDRKSLLVGYFTPIAYAFAAYAFIWTFQLGGFPNQSYLTEICARYVQSSPSVAVIIDLVVIGTVAMVPGAFAALGEEIGWRGFLVPQLSQTFSPRQVGLISGLIWALWHYPSILFDGYNNGTPLPYAITCFTIMVVAFGLITTWLRLRSHSIWPCVLAHATHNNFIELFFSRITIDTAATKYFADEFGICICVTVLIAAWLICRHDVVPAPGLLRAEQVALEDLEENTTKQHAGD